MRCLPSRLASLPVLALLLAHPLRAAELAVVLDTARVERFAKIELAFEGPRTYANPHDPAEVSAWAEIAVPSGANVMVPAFFFQPFDVKLLESGGRRLDWLYPSGHGRWTVRFAPSEVGQHSASVVLRDRDGVHRSSPVRFECLPSARKGFLRVSTHDQRYFERTSGEDFFAIGQNVAFLGPSQYMYGSAKVDQVFGAIAAQGGNFVRVWVCCEDWAMAIEARKSAWARSWSWKPPLVPMPGDGARANAKCIRIGSKAEDSVSASPTRPLAVKPATAYRLAGRLFSKQSASLAIAIDGAAAAPVACRGTGQWEAFELRATTRAEQHWVNGIALRLREAGGEVLLDGLSLREEKDGIELLSQAEVNRPIEGSYDETDSRFFDEVLASAEKHGLALEVTFVTRDLYMARLSKEDSPEYAAAITAIKNLARYFVARWGYSTSVGTWEYFNEMDPGKPLDRFYRELKAHFAEIDPYRHPIATSAWSPCPRDWAHPALDTADMHFYLRPTLGAAFKDAAASVAERASFLRARADGKPALLAEFGLAGDKWELSDYMRKDKDYLHGHDALWATTMAGLAGASMSWWWEDFDRMDLYRHYAPLAAFVADIPFTTASFAPRAWREADPALHAQALCGERLTCLWLSDPAASWWNVVVEGRAPAHIANAAVTIPDLPEGAYRIQWWDTYAGKCIREDTRTLAKGERLQVPPFTRDIAAKLVRDPGSR